MGTKTEVSAKRKDNDYQVTVGFDFGDNLEEAVEKFGSEVVFVKFKQSAIIDLQSIIRREMFEEVVDKEGNVTELKRVGQEKIQAAVDSWKPGATTRVIKSPKEKAMEALKNMSPAEIKAMLAELNSPAS